MTSLQKEVFYFNNTIHDDSSIIINQAEQAFIKRSFQRALHLSNQFLQQEHRSIRTNHSNNNNNNNKRIIVNIPCTKDDIFYGMDATENENKTSFFRLEIDTTRTTTTTTTIRDRALAVALQSWYEIKQQHTSEDGKQYLIPFRRALVQSSISFELFVILLRFYIQMSQYSSAIWMATICLRQCQYMKQDTFHQVWNEISNILFLELLPYYPTMVPTVVRWLNNNIDDDNDETTKDDTDTLVFEFNQIGTRQLQLLPAACSKLQKGTLELLISSWNPDSKQNCHKNYADWFQTSIDHHMIQWKRMLHDLEKQEEQQQQEQDSIIIRAQKQFYQSTTFTLLSRHLVTEYYKHILFRLKQLIMELQRNWNQEKTVFKCTRVTTTMIGFALLAYYYHKHKQRLLSMLRSFLYEALTQPVKEIVEALQLV